MDFTYAKLVIVAVIFHCSTASLYDVFVPCCHEGVKWSSISYRCDNYPAPVVNITDFDQAACLSIVEVCCIKQTQMNTCEEGKQTALDGHVCAIRDADPGAEQFRECCQCCRLGLESRQYQPACQSPGLGEPCDVKYRECCLGEETHNSNFTGAQTDKDSDPEVDDDETITGLTTEEPTLDLLTTTATGGADSMDNVSTTQAPLPPATTTSAATSAEGEGDSNNNGDENKNDSDDKDKEDNDKDTGDKNDEEREEVDKDRYTRCRNGHRCQHRCVDSLQGKKCVCYSGYRMKADGRSCLDIDECVEGLSRCAPSQRCVNTEGRYTCISNQCPEGYTFSQVTNRCEYELVPIQCDKGFSYSSLSGKCEDINECGLGTDSCIVGERCENTLGSYSCRRIHHCGTGYTLDDQSQDCIDIDECRLGTHNCGGGYLCQNMQGSFRCAPKPCNSTSRFNHIKGRCELITCPKGFKPNTVGRCVDMNECTEPGRPVCRRFQRCVNTRGSHYCVNIVNCPTGHEPTDKNTCQDIDECVRGTHKCGPEQQCINRQGTYFCQCPRGLRHDNLGRCIDVDECSYGASICPSNSKCVNTLGSYKCECVDGLKVGDGDSCTDIDECSQQGICQQSCVNVLGTFFCTCDRGYQLRDDKRSCEDIDECTQFGGRGGRSGVCGGHCVNVPGSYRCECPNGWRLKDDDRSCYDVNECKEGTAYCPSHDSMCINTRGGYKCPVVTCPQGYLKTNSSAQQNSIRCKRISTTCPECLRGLISRSFNFLSFASNVLVPAPLFSMTGSRLVDKFYTWGLELVSARPMQAGVKPATTQHFSLERSRDFARVTLVKQAEGPQDVVLQLNMNVTNYYTGFEGNAQSHIYLYITEADQH